MKFKKLLVIDPDVKWSRELSLFLKRDWRLRVANPIRNGDTALSYIKLERPDIIVMEMLLHGCDGLYLLRYLQYHMRYYNPLVYIVSHMPVDAFAEQYQSLLEFRFPIYMAIKPQAPECIADNLSELHWNREIALQLEPDGIRPASTAEKESLERIDWALEAFLYRLDLRLRLKRGRAMKTVLQVLLLEGREIVTMTDVYKRTAERLDATNHLAVERLVRNFKNAAFENNTEYYQSNFPQEPLTNQEFCWRCLALIKEDVGENLLQAIEKRK